MGTTITNIIGINPKDLPSDPSFDESRLGMSINPDNGAIYKTTVQDWVDLLTGLGLAYAGSAETTTDPGTPTNPIFYSASGGDAGATYTNFLDSTSTAIDLAAGEFAFLSYNVSGGYWVKQKLDVDLSGYLQNSLAVIAPGEKALDAAQGKVLLDAVKSLTVVTDAYIPCRFLQRWQYHQLLCSGQQRQRYELRPDHRYELIS